MDTIRKLEIVAILAALALLATAPAARGESAPVRVTGPVPWVSLMQGAKQSLMLKQLGSDWFQATVNTPLGQGDQVWQDKGGSSEIYLGRGSYVRLDAQTGVVFDHLAENSVTLTVTRGEAIVRNGGPFSMTVNVPGESVAMREGSGARFMVRDDGTTTIRGLAGTVSAQGPSGEVRVGAGDNLTTDSKGNVQNLARGTERDKFQAWSDSRDAALSGASAPDQAVSGLPGPVLGDFAQYGHWINTPEYGWVWEPDEDPGWTPYQVGYWDYVPGWGYTWISYEPWGWYPFHYGRWIQVGTEWAWSPIYLDVGWSPALVFWIEDPDFIAWEPIPFGVVDLDWFFGLGPLDWYGYVNPRCITVVDHDHFRRGDYRHGRLPWPGRDGCHGRCSFTRAPLDAKRWHGPTGYNRTPLPRGFVPDKRAPLQDRMYAVNRSPGTHSRTVRVNYGSHGGNHWTMAQHSPVAQHAIQMGHFPDSAKPHGQPGRSGSTRSTHQPAFSSWPKNSGQFHDPAGSGHSAGPSSHGSMGAHGQRTSTGPGFHYGFTPGLKNQPRGNFQRPSRMHAVNNYHAPSTARPAPRAGYHSGRPAQAPSRPAFQRSWTYPGRVSASARGPQYNPPARESYARPAGHYYSGPRMNYSAPARSYSPPRTSRGPSMRTQAHYSAPRGHGGGGHRRH